MEQTENNTSQDTSTKAVTKQEEAAVDTTLVEIAYTKLSEIFSKHYENAMIESGEYIIKNFYNDNIELARANKPSKNRSLLELIERMQKRASTSPSKSWIYNAVKLVVQNEDCKNFHTYGNLMLSHKVELLRVSDIKNKEKLINEIAEKNHTIRQLHEKVLKLKSKGKNSLIKLISHPEALFKNENLISVDHLEKLPKKEFEKVESKVSSKIDNVQKEIDSLDSKLKEQKDYLIKYREFIQKIETAKAKKTEDQTQDTNTQPA